MTGAADCQRRAAGGAEGAVAVSPARFTRGLASDPRTDQLKITREGAVAVFAAAKSPIVTGMSRPVLRAAIFVVYATLEPQIAVLMTPVP